MVNIREEVIREILALEEIRPIHTLKTFKGNKLKNPIITKNWKTGYVKISKIKMLLKKVKS